ADRNRHANHGSVRTAPADAVNYGVNLPPIFAGHYAPAALIPVNEHLASVAVLDDVTVGIERDAGCRRDLNGRRIGHGPTRPRQAIERAVIRRAVSLSSVVADVEVTSAPVRQYKAAREIVVG